MSKDQVSHTRRSSHRKMGKSNTPREIALDILVQVVDAGAYSHLSLKQVLQNTSLSKVDAALATELVYGTISRQSTLDYWLNQYVSKGLKKLDSWVHQLLRMSAYQLLYLDRIPAHAAVHEGVTIAKKRGHTGISGMVNGVLRSIVRNIADCVPANIQANDPITQISLRHSFPEWLVRYWADQYGIQQSEAICEASNEHPHASVRVNTMVANRDQLLLDLESEGIMAIASKLSPAGIVVQSGGNLVETEWFHQGYWSLQDESSMLVAAVAAPEPGMKVLDCCAAPGGKTAHLGELMEGRGKVWANDLHAHKRELIVSQTERLKLRNVEAITGDAMALKEQFKTGSMDVVLLDAPCTGLGVIRRKPEMKWTKTAGDIREIAALQRTLLHAVCGLVRPGGTLIYSTCTIAKEENEEQVHAFLQENPQFELAADWPSDIMKMLREAGAIGDEFDGQLQLLPQQFGSDGFYIARMRRRP